jgi:magnesium-protoporphyrin IX monomethyl ester (oxidative) cyclase
MTGGVDVCLVLVPYGALQRPSIALGILKQALVEAGYGAEVIYGSFAFAEEIGAGVYDALGRATQELAGEWTFAGAAFPDFAPDHDLYLAELGAIFAPGSAEGAQRVGALFHSIRNRTDRFIDRLADEVLARHPRIVGVSSSFMQHCAALALLRRIKEKAPEVVTLLGGANCEGVMGRATLLSCPWVDYVVMGEADLLLPPLVGHMLRQGRDIAQADLPEGVFGPASRRLWQADPQSLPVSRARVERLDDTPIPDYSDYFRALAASPLRDRITPGLLIETSRGCWWGAIRHCTFCGLNGGSIGFRAKSPNRALDELDVLVTRHDIRDFQALDNIIDLGYFDSVIPRLAERGDLNLFYETKANLSRQQVAAMAAAGIRWIQPGIESLNDSLLTLMNKGTTAAVNLQTLKWAREHGLHVAWSVLYGFPGEDDRAYAEMAAFLPLLHHLQPPQAMVRLRVERFSRYQEDPAQYGLRLSPAWAYGSVYPLEPELLADLCYTFDHQDGGRMQTTAAAFALSSSKDAGMSAPQRLCGAAVDDWIAAFRAPLPPLLCLETDGRILDTRAVAPQRQLTLSGLALELPLLCDRATTAFAAVAALARNGRRSSLTEVEEALADLVDRKLMLRISGKYLALPTRGDVPALPQPHQFPGGHVGRGTPP